MGAGYAEELFLDGPGCYLDCGWRIGFRTWMSGPAVGGGGAVIRHTEPAVVLPGLRGAPLPYVVPLPAVSTPTRP